VSLGDVCGGTQDAELLSPFEWALGTRVDSSQDLVFLIYLDWPLSPFSIQ
jgi:hypothetical protein